MKSLKPSHREDKRYLLIEGKSLNQKIIDKIILDFIGILGHAKACPKVISQKEDKMVLAINRAELDKVRASILLSDKELRITKVSGSLKKLM